MIFSIQQLSDDSKFSQALRFYPRVVKRAYSPFHRKRPEQQGFTLKRQSFCDILLI